MSLSETGLKGVTTRKMLAGVMKFLDMNRKLYHKKALLGLVRENRNKSDEIAGSMPYTNAEIKRMLDGTKKLRTKAIIHFFKDTGARPQVLAVKAFVNAANCVPISRLDEENEKGTLFPVRSSFSGQGDGSC